MADIVFETLLFSPETVGDGAAALPVLSSYGSEVLDAGIGVLPRLSGASAGTYSGIEIVTGAGASALPTIKSHGTNYTTGIYVTTEGYAYGYLPLISSAGYDAALTPPSAGSASASIPAVSSDAVGSLHLSGTSASALPLLRSFGFESAGEWGVAILPLLSGGASENADELLNYISAIGHQGATSIFVANDFFATMEDTLNVTVEAEGFDLPNLISTLNMTGSVINEATLRNSLTETMNFSDALATAWAVMLTENVQLAGDVSERKLFICALIDSLHAVGAVETRMDAVAAATSALVMESMIQNGWSTTASDTVEFTDAYEATARMFASLVDTALISSNAAMTMRLVAICADTVDITGTSAASLVANVELSDSVMLYMNVSVGGGEYAGWVLNTDSKGASEYRNYPFDSLVMFGDKLLCAGVGGIYQSGGDTDDGENIDAFIRTGLMDFGTGKYKRVPDVFVGKKGSGELVMKVVTTSGRGEKVEDWYIAEPDPRGAEAREGRFKLGKGVESLYFQFVVHNKAGGDLELAKVALRPVVLSRRT